MKNLSPLLRDAPPVSSRYGDTKELTQISISSSDPLDRLNQHKERKEDIIAQIAEVIWVVGGSREIRYLTPFLKRAPEFSDDGIVWRAGYGYRLRSYVGEIDQLKLVLEILKKDLYSRRAFITITSPDPDLQNGKDIACNQMINLLVRKENGVDKLNMTVNNRSNDCFVYETKIPLLDGTEWEIGKLAQEKSNESFWVYSNDHNGNFVPGLAHHPRFVRNVTQLIEVTLDNNLTERCTPEHKWMLRDGTYKEAKDLVEGDSLMPLYRRLDSGGYEQILDLNSNTYKNTHTLVNFIDQENYEKTKERVYKEEPLKRLVTHHKDFNKRNNTPENLQWMGWDEHRIYHQENIKILNILLKESPEYEDSRRRIKLGQLKGPEIRFSSPDAREFQSKIMTKMNFDMWSSQEFRERMNPIQSKNGKENITKLWGQEWFRKMVTENSRSYISTEERKEQTRERLRKVNRDPDFKEKQKQGRLKKLEDPVYAENSKEKRRKGSQTELAIQSRKLYLKPTPEGQKKSLVTKLNIVIDHLSSKNLELNKENYNQAKKELNYRGAPTFETIGDYVINHKIKSIKVVDVNPTPVYDLTVDKYNNFALSSGVHVHNCLWGYSGINYFEFTFLQEFIANQLGVELGYYVHNSMSFHVYEPHYEKLENVINEELESREDIYCPKVKFDSLEQFDKCFELYKNTIDKILNKDGDYFLIWKEFKENLDSIISYESLVYFEIPILYLLLESDHFLEQIKSYIEETYLNQTSLFYEKVNSKFNKRSNSRLINK